MAKDTTELAPTSNAAASNALAIPADLQSMITHDRPAGKDEGDLGTEGIGQDDITIPRVGLAQKMSDEIDETKPKYIKDLKFMDLYNSVSRVKYGRGPLHFVILKRLEPRWNLYRPIDEGGGLIEKNLRASDPRTKFGPDGEKPEATMFLDYMILLLNGLAADPIDNIMALSLKSSGIKAAKHLNFLVGTRGEKMLCKGVYEATTDHDVDKKSGGTYAIYKFKNAGWLAAGSALEKLAVELFEAWKDREAKVDVEDELTPDVDSFDPAELEKQQPSM